MRLHSSLRTILCSFPLSLAACGAGNEPSSPASPAADASVDTVSDRSGDSPTDTLGDSLAESVDSSPDGAIDTSSDIVEDAADAAADQTDADAALPAPKEDCTGPSYAAGDDLAEDNLGYWDVGSLDVAEVGNAVTLETAVVHDGATAIRFTTSSLAPAALTFPSTRTASWDLSLATALRVWVYVTSPSPLFLPPTPELRLVSNGKGALIYRPASDLLSGPGQQWIELVIPLAGDPSWTRTQQGEVTFAAIDSLELWAHGWGQGFSLVVDGLRFEGPGPIGGCLPSLDAPDLDVTLIERTPRYPRYDVSDVNGVPVVANLGAKHAPAAGDAVTWTAHVANKGSQPAAPYRARWTMDGVEAVSIQAPGLAPAATASWTLPWTVLAGRHTIAFEADVDGEVSELTGVNNRLEVATDAYAFGLFVEQGACAVMQAGFCGKGSRSCEDWLQRSTAEAMNGLLAASTYPSAPQGASARVRVDRIEHVADGALSSDPQDLDMDGVWGFRASTAVEYANYRGLTDNYLVHELSHKLGLIDLYYLNIDPDKNLVNAGKYYWDEPVGVMYGGGVGSVFRYEEHSVFGLHSTTGHRRGHAGEYLVSLPVTCRLRVKNHLGDLVPSATVALYQKNASSVVDATPEHQGTLDGASELTLPNVAAVPFTTVTGHTQHDNPFGNIDRTGMNGVFLLKMTTGVQTEYGVVRLTDFNLAWAKGETQVATVEVMTRP